MYDSDLFIRGWFDSEYVIAPVVLSSVSKTLSLNFNVNKQVVVKSLATSYNVVRQISKTLALSYNISGVVPVGYAATILADSPTAYFRLGEASGTTAVNEVGANGTYQGSPTLNQPGAMDGNTAVYFSGSNQVLLPSDALLPANSSVTIEFWNYVASGQVLGGGAFDIGASANPRRCQAHVPYTDNVVYWDYGENYASGGRLSANYAEYLDSWTLVQLTYDVATSKRAISFNGIEVASAISAQVPAVALAGGWIGYSGAGGYHRGTVDEFAVYNYVLTPAQRAAHYRARPTTLPTDLTAYYKLDEVSGTRKDFVGANHLTDHGSTPSAAGKLGQSASMNGTSQYLSHVDAPAFKFNTTDAMTVSFWIYQNTLSPNRAFINKWNYGTGNAGWGIQSGAGDANGITVFLATSASDDGSGCHAEFAAGMAANTWYHIAIVMDGRGTDNASRLKCYVNGVQKTITVGAGFVHDFINPDTCDLNIGFWQGLNRWLDGRIDEIAFWRRPLSSDEISTLYNGGAGYSYTQIVGSPPTDYKARWDSAVVPSTFHQPHPWGSADSWDAWYDSGPDGWTMTGGQSNGYYVPSHGAFSINGIVVADFINSNSNGAQFGVHNYNTWVAPNQTWFIVAETNTVADSAQALQGATRYGPGMYLNNGVLVWQDHWTGDVFSHSAPVAANVPFMAMFGYDGTTAKLRLDRAGAAAPYPGRAGGWGADAANQNVVGQSNVLNSRLKIAEIIVFDRALSAAEVSAMENYLYNKWLSAPTVTPVSKTVAVSFNIKVPVAKSLALSYKVNSQLAKTAALSYNVRKQISQAKALSFNIIALGAVAKSFSLAYNVRRQVPDTLALNYNVQARVAVKSLATSYNVKKAISKTQALTFNVRISVADSQALSYIVKKAIVKTVAPAYSVRAYVLKALSPSYAVRKIISTAVALSFKVISRVAVKSQALSYIVQKQIPKAVALNYSVKVFATDSLAVTFTVKKAIVKTVSLAFNVIAPEWTLLASNASAAGGANNIVATLTRDQDPYTIIVVVDRVQGVVTHTVSDSKGNTYQTDHYFSGTNSHQVSSSKPTTLLKAGDTVTVSFGTNGFRAVLVYQVSNLNQAAWFKQAVSGSGSGTALDSGTSSLPAGNYELLGAGAFPTATFTPGTDGQGGTYRLLDNLVISGSGQNLATDHIHVLPASTLAYKAAATMSVSSGWGMIFVAYNYGVPVGTVSQAVQVNFNVVGRPLKSQAVAYNIRKTVAKTIAPSYTVTKAVAKAATLSYTVKAPVAVKSVALAYTVRKTITKTVTPAYTVVGRIAKTLALNYNVSASGVWKPLTLNYKINKLVTKTAALSYSIQTRVAVKSVALAYKVQVRVAVKSVALTYGVAGRVAVKSLVLAYNIRTRVAVKSIALVYNIQKIVPKTLAPTYNVRKFVAKPLALTYFINRTVTVTSFSVAYSIRPPAVSVALPVNYYISGGVKTSLPLSYAVQRSTAKTCLVSYNIRVKSAKALSVNYTVRVRVPKLLVFSYRTRITVSDSYVVSYRLINTISKSRSFSYTIKRLAARQVTPSYKVRKQIPQALSPAYKIRRQIAKPLAVTYTVKRAVAKTVTVSFKLKVVLAKSPRFTYNVRQRVLKSVAVSFRLRVVRAKPLTLTYKLQTQVRRSVTATFGVAGKLQVVLVLNYRIRTDILIPGDDPLSGKFSAALLSARIPNWAGSWR